MSQTGDWKVARTRRQECLRYGKCQRPLKRAIQEHLLDPLATKLLAGEFKPGERIKVSANGDKLVFQRK